LALVYLPFFQRRIRIAEAIGGQADLAQDPRLLPIDDLRSHDPHTLHALGSFDQRGHCSGVEHGVVVQEEDVVGLGGHVGPQAPTHCPGEPEVAFARQDPVRS